jgi:hypothetical protein
MCLARSVSITCHSSLNAFRLFDLLGEWWGGDWCEMMQAAQVMYEAFRAMRSTPDMTWDLTPWQRSLEKHVEV